MPEKRTLSDEQKAALINHLNNLYNQAKHLQLQLFQKQQESKQLMKLAIPLGLDYVSIQKEIEDKRNHVTDQIMYFIY